MRNIAWTHRRGDDFDIYFISNQLNTQREIEVTLRKAGCIPEIYDPVTGEIGYAKEWELQNGRTIVPIQLTPYGSLFIVLQKKTKSKAGRSGKNWREYREVLLLDTTWEVQFDTNYGGPDESILYDTLEDWTSHTYPGIKYYSGTAHYKTAFFWEYSEGPDREVWLNLGEVANIAEVWVNDIYCGVAWTVPYRVPISKALRKGENKLRIEVTNTWANRLIGDQRLPEDERVTWTTAPYRLAGKPLLKSGLTGPVRILIE